MLSEMICEWIIAQWFNALNWCAFSPSSNSFSELPGLSHTNMSNADIIFIRKCVKDILKTQNWKLQLKWRKSILSLNMNVVSHRMCQSCVAGCGGNRPVCYRPHLDVVADAVRATHLEEDAVVDDGQVGVQQAGAHHRKPAVVVLQLQRKHKKELIYLTTHSTHFIYGYNMEGRKCFI